MCQSLSQKQCVYVCVCVCVCMCVVCVCVCARARYLRPELNLPSQSAPYRQLSNVTVQGFRNQFFFSNQKNLKAITAGKELMFWRIQTGLCAFFSLLLCLHLTFFLHLLISHLLLLLLLFLLSLLLTFITLLVAWAIFNVSTCTVQRVRTVSVRIRTYSPEEQHKSV